MAESTNATLEFPALRSRDVLTEILRNGAQQMLATAIEAEVGERKSESGSGEISQ